MDNACKEITRELSKILDKTTFNYFVDKFNDKDVNISILLNIISSAYLSSCFHMMSIVSEDHSEIKKSVSVFIENILLNIKQNDFIKDVKVNEH